MTQMYELDPSLSLEENIRRHKEMLKRERIHSMYRRLNEKIDMVREWPDVTGPQFDRALAEAKDSGRLARFDANSPDNPGLDVVVCVYKHDPAATLCYAQERMAATFGSEFFPLPDVYAGDPLELDVQYLKDGAGRTVVSEPRDCVRIEVVDLFANREIASKVSPQRWLSPAAAHFAVLFAAAQDPDWIWAMDGIAVPYAIATGLEIAHPGNTWRAHSPSIHRHSSHVMLSTEFRCNALGTHVAYPVLWE